MILGAFPKARVVEGGEELMQRGTQLLFINTAGSLAENGAHRLNKDSLAAICQALFQSIDAREWCDMRAALREVVQSIGVHTGGPEGDQVAKTSAS